MTRLALVATVAAAAFVLAACGGQDSNPPGSDVVETSDGAAPPPVSNTGPASGDDASVKADVKITSCKADGYTPTVGLEVTNSTSEAQRYAVRVLIKDPAGKESGEALFAKNRMEPGQKVTQEIPGDTPVKGAITCEVDTAKRLPPK